MKDISRNASAELNDTMQSAPHIGHPSVSHSTEPGMPSQSLYPQSYNLPHYDGGSSLPNPYSRDSMFSNPTSSSASLPFGGLNDITPSLFGPGMLGSRPYHPPTHPLHLPPRTAPGLLNYGQSGIQPTSHQHHLFPSPSPYPGYPSPLPMGLSHNQSMAERYLLSAPSHMMSRFPGLHPRAGSPLTGYGVPGDAPGLRPPFSSSLLSDRKTGASPLTSLANGSDLDVRGDLNSSRKKRKACGHCGPCQRKENCGSCMNCINRAKGKQICIHRKCEVLKKKPGSSPYLPPSEPAPSKPEKRKDLDDFVSNVPKRSKTKEAAPNNLPQGLIHPTQHPNFSEFGELNRTVSHHSTPTSQEAGDNCNLSQPTLSSELNTDLPRQPYYPEPHSTPYPPSAIPSSESSTTEHPVQIEESDFINQALQAIESNIESGRTIPEPVSNNSISDTSSSALGNSLQSQGTPSNPQSLQSPQRRASQDPNFGWNRAPNHPADPIPGQLSNCPPPHILPTGPGPGSGEQSAGVDQLLNNLGKFNSPTSFPSQSSPIKEPPNPPQERYLNANIVSQKSYATEQNLQENTPEGQASLSNPKVSPQFHSQHSTNNTPQRPSQSTDHSIMYQANIEQYPDHSAQRNPDPSRMLAYEQQQNRGYRMNSQMYQAGTSLNPSYSGQMFCSNQNNTSNTDNRFPYTAPNVQRPPADYPSKPATSQRYPYPTQQPHPHYQLMNTRQPAVHSQAPYSGSSQHYNPYGPGQQYGVQGPSGQIKMPDKMTPRHPAARVPSNDNQWNFQAPQAPGINQSTNLTSPHDLQQRPNYAARRTSHTPGDCYPATAPRHLSGQSAGSGSNTRSPMMQSSPAGVVSHSPFAGSAGSSLRSPISNMMGTSPASMPQAQATSPSMVSMPHLATSPITTNVPAVHSNVPSSDANVGDPNFQRNMQTYRPWHEQQDPNARTVSSISYHGHVTQSVAPSNAYSQKLDPMGQTSITQASNHFLAPPGSSPSLPAHEQLPHSQNGSVPNGNRNFHGDLAFSAARLHQLAGGASHVGNTNASGAHYDPRKTFTETMNSVLYGQADVPDKPNPTEIKTASSPTDPQSTISPGESGYDSADLVSTIESQRSAYEGSIQNTAGGSTELQQAKNLHAASAGLPHQQASEFDLPSTRTGLSLKPGTNLEGSVSSSSMLPAGAAVTSSCSNFPIEAQSYLPHSLRVSTERGTISTGRHNLHRAFTAPEITSQPKTGMSRSHSIDHCSDRMETDKIEKRTVSLRRYSSQGIGIRENIPRPKTLGSTPAFNPTQILHSATVSCTPNHPTYTATNTTPLSVSHPLPKPGFFPQPISTQLPSPYPAPKYPQPTFETPPQTPQSFAPRSMSSESSASSKIMNQPEMPPMKLTSDDLRGRTITHKAANGSDVKRHIFPRCNCIAGTDGLDEPPPYYTHLGAAESIKGIRKLFEDRCGIIGKALRIEKVCYTGKEGKTSRGCPIAKWVLRRSSEEEKVLVICRQRPGHRCLTAVMVVVIMLWEGVSRPLADFSYQKCTELIPTNGTATERRCATNEERTCACQGFDPEKGGASYSFGCSWSMYYNGCKFARSTNPNKFKLLATKDSTAENFVADFCQRLASAISVLYKTAAPDAHRNQTERESEGKECRLGYNPESEGRPFSGVTCCMDFCAHAHKDQHNMENGTTLVLTLTKPELRVIGQKPVDEQLHVLPLYKLDLTNEDGTFEGVGQKIREGSIEILSGFRRQVRLRDKPVGTCKQRKQKRTKDGLDVSPLKKKRGRKPKRSLSMENLTSTPTTPTTPQQWNTNQWTTSPSGLKVPPHPQNFDPTKFRDPILSPPPRWPYRRHVTPTDDSNLPSIGSFFSPNSHGPKTPQDPSLSPAIFGTPPITPIAASPLPSFQFGRRLSSTSPSMGNFAQSTHQNSSFRAPSPASYTGKMPPGQATPLPSLNTVMHHPFHQTFAAVKSEPSADPVTFYHHPQPDNKINLKSYAAAVKNEPVTSYPSLATHLPSNPQPQNPHIHPPNPHYQAPNPQSEPPQFQAPRRPQQNVFSDSEENFMDQDIGGVAIAPGHGSVLIECAKRELHATTSLMYPNRFHPSRISLVFYQHKSMNYRNHGAAEYEIKETKRNQAKAEKALKEKEEREEAERRESVEKQRVINEAESLIARLNPQYPLLDPGLPQQYQYTRGYAPMTQDPRWSHPPPVSRTATIRGELPNMLQATMINRAPSVGNPGIPRNPPYLAPSSGVIQGIPHNIPYSTPSSMANQGIPGNAPYLTPPSTDNQGIPRNVPYSTPQLSIPIPQPTAKNAELGTAPRFTPPSYHPVPSPHPVPSYYNSSPRYINPPSYPQPGIPYSPQRFQPPTTPQYSPSLQNQDYKQFPQQHHYRAPYQNMGTPQRPPVYYQYHPG